MRARFLFTGLSALALTGCNVILGLGDFSLAEEGNGGAPSSSSGTLSAGGGGAGGAPSASSSDASSGAGGDNGPASGSGGAGGSGGSAPGPLICTLSEPPFTILSASDLGTSKLDKEASNLSVFGTRGGQTYFGVSSSSGKYFIQNIGSYKGTAVSFQATVGAKFKGRVTEDAFAIYGTGIGSSVDRVNLHLGYGINPTIPNPLVADSAAIDICEGFIPDVSWPDLSGFTSTFIGDDVYYAVRASCNSNSDTARVSIYQGKFPDAQIIATRTESIPIYSTDYISWFPTPRNNAYFPDTGISYIQFSDATTSEIQFRFGKTLDDLGTPHPFLLTDIASETRQILGVAPILDKGGLMMVAASGPTASAMIPPTLRSGFVSQADLGQLADVPPAPLGVTYSFSAAESTKFASFSEPAILNSNILFTGVSRVTGRTLLMSAFTPDGQLREISFPDDEPSIALPISSLATGARSMGQSVVTVVDSNSLLVAWVGPETESSDSSLVLRGQYVDCF